MRRHKGAARSCACVLQIELREQKREIIKKKITTQTPRRIGGVSVL